MLERGGCGAMARCGGKVWRSGCGAIVTDAISWLDYCRFKFWCKYMENSDIQIQVVTLHKHPWPGNLEPRFFSRENVPKHIECCDQCNGEISRDKIIEIVEDILRNDKKSSQVKCSGNDGYRNCHRYFKITVDVRNVT